MLTGSCLELLPHGRRGVRIDQTPATRARARLRGCVGARPPCAYAKQPGRRARSRAADAAAWAGAAAGHRRRAAARRHAGARCALPLALQHCVRRPAHGGCYIGGTLCWTHMRLAQSLLCLLIPPPPPGHEQHGLFPAEGLPRGVAARRRAGAQQVGPAAARAQFRAQGCSSTARSRACARAQDAQTITHQPLAAPPPPSRAQGPVWDLAKRRGGRRRRGRRARRQHDHLYCQLLRRVPGKGCFRVGKPLLSG